jgi:hypothetical protein
VAELLSEDVKITPTIMRWVQACRRQGCCLVGPTPQRESLHRHGSQGEKCALDRRILVGVRYENLFHSAFLISPPPVHNISALLNGATQGCFWGGTSHTITKYWFIKHPSRPQSRNMLIDQSETLEPTTIVASNYIIDRCFSRYLIRSKLPGDLHAAT